MPYSREQVRQMHDMLDDWRRRARVMARALFAYGDTGDKAARCVGMTSRFVERAFCLLSNK
jgi:hypothetical protein